MAFDTLILSGVSLNDQTNYGLEAIDFTPPTKRTEWVAGSDADGSDLVRKPFYDNRTITMRLRVGVQSTMDGALETIGALVALLQEAELNPEGVPLEYTPAGATNTKKITFYVLSGAITAVPIVNEGSDAGWYAHTPVVTVQLVCKPFGYGVPVEGAAAKSITAGLSIVELVVPAVEGDVPAEARLVVKDTAKVGRRFVEWGLESRYYNALRKLVIAAEALTPVGGVRSEAANTGAYSPSSTKKTIATTLLPEPTVCFETGVQQHVGSYRVKLRQQVVLGAGSAAQNVHVRLSYQDGEGPLRANPWVTPVLAGEYVEADLGVITVTPFLVGTQKWLGKVEAYSTNAAAKDTHHGNYLVLVPAEAYGKATGPAVIGGATVVAYDNFTTGTLSGALNTRTPALGAAWATSGSTTDWTVTAGAVERKTVSDASPRLGVFGAAIGNQAVSMEGVIEVGSAAGQRTIGAVARFVDSSNYAFAVFTPPEKLTVSCRMKVGVVIAGVKTVLAEALDVTAELAPVAVNLTATLDGNLSAVFTLPIGVRTVNASSATIATGGTLASGNPGIYDLNASTNELTRRITKVAGSTLPAVPYCVQPERSMEVRSDSTIGFDSTGTYTGPVPQYRGSRFFVPQQGSAAREARVLVKADRNNLEESGQQTIADAFTAQVFVTPRYSVIPH